MPTLVLGPTKDASSLLAQIRRSTTNVVRVSSNSKTGEEHALFHFNVSSIPTGSTISAATLSLTLIASTGWTASTELIGWGRITADWAESDTTAGPSVGGADAYFQSQALGSTDPRNFNVLTLVQAWFAGTITNYGVYFEPHTAVDSGDYVEFASREHATTGSRPSLSITYTVPTPTAPGAWTNPTVDTVRTQDGGTFLLNWGDGGTNGGPVINDYRIEYAYKLNSGDAWGAWVDWTWVGSATSQFNWSVGSGGNDGFYKFRVRTWNNYNYSAYGPESPAVQLVPNVQTVSPGGIASAEAVGGATVVPGARILSAAGAIASEEAVGTPSMSSIIALLPGAIGSAEAFGTSVVKVGWILYPSSIGSAEALGSPTLVRGTVIVSAAGNIASGYASGAHTLYRVIAVSPSGIASLEAVGNPVIVRGPVTVSPGAIASGESLGSPTVIPGVRVLSAAGAIASAEALGTPNIYALIVLTGAGGIASAEAMGPVIVIPGNVNLGPGGIASQQAFGVPFLIPPALVWIEDYIEPFGLIRLIPQSDMLLVRTWGSIIVLNQVEDILDLGS